MLLQPHGEHSVSDCLLSSVGSTGLSCRTLKSGHDTYIYIYIYIYISDGHIRSLVTVHVRRVDHIWQLAFMHWQLQNVKAARRLSRLGNCLFFEDNSPVQNVKSSFVEVTVLCWRFILRNGAPAQ